MCTKKLVIELKKQLQAFAEQNLEIKQPDFNPWSKFETLASFLKDML